MNKKSFLLMVSTLNLLILPVFAMEETKDMYEFPADAVLKFGSGHKIDLSGHKIDLNGIFIGGIGRTMSSAIALVNGMKSIGNNENVYNLGCCIVGDAEKDDINFHCINDDNKDFFDKKYAQKLVAEIIEKTIKKTAIINIAIDMHKHASLATLIVSDDDVSIFFYDSLAEFNKEEHGFEYKYNKRYNHALINSISSLLLPKKMDIKHQVVHLLDQGGADSNGCGYYTLYTAWLLRNNPALIDYNKHNSELLFTKKDEKKIYAELIIVNMLNYGLKKIHINSNSFDYLFHKNTFSYKTACTDLALFLKARGIKYQEPFK